MSGTLDVPCLEAAFRELALRHDTLRTTFAQRGERLLQCVHETLPFDFCVEAATDQSLAERIDVCVRHRFDLEHGPLWQVHLWETKPQRYTLLWVLHHSIVDLATKTIFSTELSALYRRRIQTTVTDPEVASASDLLPQQELPQTPLIRYAAKEAAWRASTEHALCEEYFAAHLRGRTTPLSLPEELERPKQRPMKGGCIAFDLDGAICARLMERCSTATTKPFLWLLATWGLLLARYSGADQAIVGVPFSNRRKWQSAAIAGCFVKTLPVVIPTPNSETFGQLLGHVRATMLEHHRHQEIGFERLEAAPARNRDPAQNPTYQAGFTFEPPMQLDLFGASPTAIKVHNGGSQLTVFLTLWPTKSGFSGHLEYASDRITPSTAQRMLDSYIALLEHTLEPDILASTPVGRLRLLSESERHNVLQVFNDTHVEYTAPRQLHCLFMEQARQREDEVAVRFRDERLTYGDLIAKASNLAHSLRQSSVLPGDHVGVYMLRSTEMVVAILAILMAGGVYLPLDPDYPRMRILQMLEDARPRHVLSHALVADAWPGSIEHLFLLDAGQLSNSRCTPPDVTVPNDAAYTIFTSGSTGRPKGATNTHHGIINRILWMQRAFQLNTSDVVLQKTPFSFDVSTWEFFWPLAAGAILEVAPPEIHRDPGALCQLIGDARVTTIHFVPAMLDAFLNHPLSARCSTLRRIIASGEALIPELVRHCTSRLPAELHNLYGPTEAAVDVTWWSCARDPAMAPVPIGRPIANTRIYILSACGEPVPIGVPGELYIGGVQVALGYVNRPELTAERFVHDPFSRDPASRLYRTGDLAKWLPDGNISYLGRMDCQVKLHGNRIELGEVEHVLNAYPGVRQSIVVLREVSNGQKGLVAYLRRDDDSADESEFVRLLRAQLNSRLPAYMIPGHYFVVSDFSLTASGKVDRAALPEPVIQQETQQGPAPASTPMQAWLLAQVAELVHLQTLSVTANLFDVGGNSITVAQLVGRIFEHHGLTVPLSKFFEYPTVAGLAAYLTKLANGLKSTSGTLARVRSKAKQRRELTRPPGRTRK